jgi:hypothetical protein
LQTGQRWDEEIDEALRKAEAVVVLWSEAAVASDWVKHEASVGKSREMLAHARIRDCVIPPTFSSIQAAALRAWNGDEQQLEFQRLARSLRALHHKRQRRALLLSVYALAIALSLTVLGAVIAFRIESIRNYLLGYFNVEFHNDLFMFNARSFKGTLSAQEIYYFIGSASGYGKDPETEAPGCESRST